MTNTNALLIFGSGSRDEHLRIEMARNWFSGRDVTVIRSKAAELRDQIW